MELLFSNFNPGKFTGIRTASDFFAKKLEEVDLIKIATGYISADSLIDLKKTIQINGFPKIEMLIGMHYFDGFTRTQYRAAMALHEFLQENGKGSVSISNAVKFHGKMYSFVKDNIPLYSIIGSSNFSSIYNSEDRLYESDVLFNKIDETTDIDNYITQIISRIGFPLHDIEINNFREYNILLKNHDGVDKIDENDLKQIWESKTKLEFNLPIKTEQKSNLNVFFGKGRLSQRGYEQPRSWYEVELIVGKAITSLIGYPVQKSFKVVTDDGWTFKCSTNGTNAKNFRSEADLKILGKWIKGRLEQSGALQIGQPVTDNVLSIYGRKSLNLIATNNANIWLLDFKQ